MAIRQTIEFTRGFFYFFRGLKTAFSSRPLALRSLLPLLANILVFSLFLISFNTVVFYLANWAFSQTSQAWYWAMLSLIAGVALFLASLLLVIFLFAAVGLIIASPFCDALSAQVEQHVTGKVEESGQPFIIQALATMRHEAKKLAIFLPIQLLLALLNFIPFAGPPLFVVLNTLFLCFVMAFEFTSFTLDRRGYGFAAKRARIMAQPAMSLGFGAAAAITLMIPIVHFLLLPAAVTGGTLLALDTLPGNPPAPGDDNPPENADE